MGLPNRDELEGKWDQVKGKTKEGIGRAIDDEDLATEGQAEHAGGKVEEGFGKALRCTAFHAAQPGQGRSPRSSPSAAAYG